MKTLAVRAGCKFLLGVVLFGVLLFLPAGTLGYANGWLLMSLLFVPMALAGVVLLRRSPSLLESRLKAKEERQAQSTVVKCSGLMFLIGFVLAGLDHRFGLSALPRGVVLGASVVFFISYLLYAEVLRENTYLSRTIEVQAGQKVIDTGLYAVVRHPMYAVTLPLFLSMPLILGSVYAFLVFLAYPFLIVRRIRDEEAFLKQELEGYEAYCQKVRYRLLPRIW